MVFNFPTEITKQDLLNKFSEETYMQHYLGFPVDKKLHINPLRDDHRPTAAFYRKSGGTLYFHDFGTGVSRDFIQVVMDKYHFNYYEAIDQIAQDFGLSYNSNSNVPIKVVTTKLQPKEPSIINVEIQEFSKDDLSWWKKFGISKHTLKKYNVFSCKTVFLNGTPFTINKDQRVFGYYGGKEENKELWRIYYPEKKVQRFLTNWKSVKIQGWDQLPAKGKLVVITKSMKDVMLLSELKIPACAPNSETMFLTETQQSEIAQRFKHVIVLYDNDLPGIHNLNLLHKKYPQFIYTWIPRKTGSKDLSDYYRDHGKEQTIDLVKSFIKWLKTQKK